MASTRNVISPGVFAQNASTTIPTPPVQGAAYRDPATSESVVNGWSYFNKVNSAEFNQWMYQYSSLLNIVDKQGILGWSDQVNYAVPAIVFGSDGNLYRALQASGPTSGGTKDPITSPTFWLNSSATNLKFAANRTSNSTITNNSATRVVYNNVVSDPSSAFDSSTGRFIVPVGASGNYDFSAGVQMSLNIDGVSYLRLYKNGARLLDGSSASFSLMNLGLVCQSTWIDIPAVAGDYFEIYILQNTGQNATLIWADETTYFKGRFVS